MKNQMKIKEIKTFHCNAGWRPWTFLKISTDEGIIGWSECTDSHGSPLGIAGVVSDLSPLLIDKDPREIEALYSLMCARTRQSPGSVIQKAIGGIENALLDIKAKALGIPVYELFGGPLRREIPLYWSHCGTSRVRAAYYIGKKKISLYRDLEALADEIATQGFRTIKTNIAVLGSEEPYVYMPGFAKSVGGPSLEATWEVRNDADAWVGALRGAVGDAVGIIVDLNFNFKTEGFIRIARALERFNLRWIELDSYDPRALRHIRSSIRTPVASGENLYGLRQYRPYFEEGAFDIVSVDVIWNGFRRSLSISDVAEVYEMNVTPHNFNGHLSTMISAQFCACVPNLALMEYDFDDVPWRDELFTNSPHIENGALIIPRAPGWGTELNEQVLKEHPWPQP